MSNHNSLRKALEFIKRHCANVIRTNSRDRDDWAEDMAYVCKVASDALEPSEAVVSADSDGDDYTPALALHAPHARIPVGLARNHSVESAWRVGWMRGWMEARRPVGAPQPAPALSRAEQWNRAGREPFKFHPQASHVSPDYRDGWNAAIDAVARNAKPST